MKSSYHLLRISENTVLEYTILGAGSNSLFCFHGFGQNLSIFSNFHTLLPTYKIIAVNLFYHGNSDRKEATKYLKHEEWKKVFSTLLTNLNIDRFSVLGYSLGGRYAISTAFSFQTKIDICILIAADGIVKRFWYEFATMPIGLQWLFKFLMNHPKPLFSFINCLERTKLMNSSIIKFSRTQLKNKNNRELIFKSWIALKKLRLKKSRLTHLFNSSTFTSHIIFGKYDKIINLKSHSKFISDLSDTRVSILEAPHHDLLNQSIPKIKSALLE